MPTLHFLIYILSLMVGGTHILESSYMYSHQYYSYIVDISIRERLHSVLSELHSELSLQKAPREELAVGRVVPLEGDLSKPRLGLRDQDYDMLCREVHVIIHNGAVVNAVLPYLGIHTIRHFCCYSNSVSLYLLFFLKV